MILLDPVPLPPRLRGVEALHLRAEASILHPWARFGVFDGGGTRLLDAGEIPGGGLLRCLFKRTKLRMATRLVLELLEPGGPVWLRLHRPPGLGANRYEVEAVRERVGFSLRPRPSFMGLVASRALVVLGRDGGEVARLRPEGRLPLALGFQRSTLVAPTGEMLALITWTSGGWGDFREGTLHLLHPHALPYALAAALALGLLLQQR